MESVSGFIIRRFGELIILSDASQPGWEKIEWSGASWYYAASSGIGMPRRVRNYLLPIEREFLLVQFKIPPEKREEIVSEEIDFLSPKKLRLLSGASL